MKLIKMHPNENDVLNTFLSEVRKNTKGIHPKVYIGFSESGGCVVHSVEMPLEELAFIIKVLEMHFATEWNHVMGK